MECSLLSASNMRLAPTVLALSFLACSAEPGAERASPSASRAPGCVEKEVDGAVRIVCPAPGKADGMSCMAEDIAHGCVDEGAGCSLDCYSCSSCDESVFEAAGGSTGWWSCKRGSASTWGGYDSDKKWAAKEAQKNALSNCQAANGWFDVCIAHEPYCTPGYLFGYTCVAQACRKAE